MQRYDVTVDRELYMFLQSHVQSSSESTITVDYVGDILSTAI